jgi:phage RecT family recombinase
MNQEIKVRKSNFEIELENYAPQIAMALPKHIPIERFQRVLMTAVARDPALYLEADRRTLWNAAIQCATEGLIPDGNEAALVIYNTKKGDQWIKAVQFLAMIAGVRKRMRNSGQVLSAEAECVFKNDEFDYAKGDEPFIKHKPNLDDPGEFRCAYAVIRLANGEILREVMSKAEIEKARAQNKSGSKEGSPWVKWYSEMARKTVLKRCAKGAPRSADMDRLLSTGPDEEDDAPALPPPERPTRASLKMVGTGGGGISLGDLDPAAAGHEDLDQRFADTMQHDPETGEIIEPEKGGGAPSGQTVQSSDEAPAAAPPVGGGQPAYDPKRVSAALWEGAVMENRPAALQEYMLIQKPLLDELRAKAPAEYTALYQRMEKLLARLRGGG